MKIKAICLAAVGLAFVLWACWSLAYRCGYSRGARDEFACWKQEPMTPEAKVLVGTRDAWLYPGGKKVPGPVFHYQDLNVNNIPVRSAP
jgi:hypothetical protein